MDEIREQPQKKQDRGEDISAEIKEFKGLKKLEDRNFEEWKENRQKIWDEYGKSQEAEQEMDYEQE